MSSSATSSETATNPQAGSPDVTTESGPALANAMNDPLVAQASALLDVLAAKYRQFNEKSAEPEIPADVPHFTTEHDPWAF